MVMRGAATLVVAAMLCAPSAGTAQDNNPYRLPIQEHVFDNGLRLLVLERQGDHRVAAKIFTDFGAMVERPGRLGAAHFLEHLMFKGTESLGTTDWSAEKPFVDSIQATERELIEELNRERNALRERGVFNDYAHARTTPRIEELYDRIALLDRGASRFRDNGAMMRWYQAYGGQRLTATTEQEYMKFDINLPVTHVELFFRIEADRMRNSVFREFDQERMILVEQRLGDLNRPTTPFYEALNATVGIIHPVYWPEGHATDFEKYTREYERKLYDEYFIPNNTTIVLIGGITFERMVEQVDRYFGWMERGPEPDRIWATEPRPDAERRLIYRSDDLTPRLDVRYRIPAIGHPERAALDVVREVVGIQLRAAFRDAGVNAGVDVNSRVVHETRFGVPATMNLELTVGDSDRLDDVEGIVDETIARLGQQPPTEAQLSLAKKRVRNDWFRTALNADELAFVIGHFQVMDSWRTLEEFLLAGERTSSADVMLLAARYFNTRNRTVGVVIPATRPSEGISGGGNGR